MIGMLSFRISGPEFGPNQSRMMIAEWMIVWVHCSLVRGTKDNFPVVPDRSEEHTFELQSLMRNSYAVFCLKKKHKYLSLLLYFDYVPPHSKASTQLTSYVTHY